LRIALTYNLRLSDSEDEAEFDTQETVNTLAAAIERLGHRLEVDAAGIDKGRVDATVSRRSRRVEAEHELAGVEHLDGEPASDLHLALVER